MTIITNEQNGQGNSSHTVVSFESPRKSLVRSVGINNNNNNMWAGHRGSANNNNNNVFGGGNGNVAINNNNNNIGGNGNANNNNNNIFQG